LFFFGKLIFATSSLEKVEKQIFVSFLKKDCIFTTEIFIVASSVFLSVCLFVSHTHASCWSLYGQFTPTTTTRLNCRRQSSRVGVVVWTGH